MTEQKAGFAFAPKQNNKRLEVIERLVADAYEERGGELCLKPGWRHYNAHADESVLPVMPRFVHKDLGVQAGLAVMRTLTGEFLPVAYTGDVETQIIERYFRAMTEPDEEDFFDDEALDVTLRLEAESITDFAHALSEALERLLFAFDCIQAEHPAGHFCVSLAADQRKMRRYFHDAAEYLDAAIQRLIDGCGVIIRKRLQALRKRKNLNFFGYGVKLCLVFLFQV